MNNIKRIKLFIIINLIFFSVLINCKEKESPKNPTNISVQNDLNQQVVQYLEQGAIVIDVRTEEEYKTGHFKDSKLIPYDQIENRIKELEQYKEKPILLYCRSGRRAGIAKQILEQYGFKNVVNAVNLSFFPADKIIY